MSKNKDLEYLESRLAVKEQQIKTLNTYIVQLEHDKTFYQQSLRTNQYCLNQLHTLLLNAQLELEKISKSDKLELAQ